MTTPSFRHAIRTTTALLLAVGLLLVGATAVSATPQRVLAIGDIHGEFDGLVKILKAAELLDDRLEWVGGDATLVQTGDFLDRGKDVRRVMDLLMSIQRQAADAGGEVIVLLGNHEQLNMVGELRPEYVTADICAAFADENSAARRRQAYEEWVDWQKRNPFFEPRSEETWNELYPLGYFEYVDAIGPEGEYGRWLRTLPVAVKVGDAVFLHGGIGPKYVSM
ncbi:MAG: metallophosphoesterase, partial [Thermoanaerobaculia bacterium]|nr:metallophosphoesterase [Thermoanaerobaculia bacterium]